MFPRQRASGASGDLTGFDVQYFSSQPNRSLSFPISTPVGREQSLPCPVPAPHPPMPNSVWSPTPNSQPISEMSHLQCPPIKDRPSQATPTTSLISPALSRSSSGNSDIPDHSLVPSCCQRCLLPISSVSVPLSVLAPRHPREGSAQSRGSPALPGKAPPHSRVSLASPPRPEKTPRHSRLGSAAEAGRSAGPAPSAQAPPLPRASSAQPGCPDSGGCGGTRGVMAASERRAFAHKINR